MRKNPSNHPSSHHHHHLGASFILSHMDSYQLTHSPTLKSPSEDHHPISSQSKTKSYHQNIVNYSNSKKHKFSSSISAPMELMSINKNFKKEYQNQFMTMIKYGCFLDTIKQALMAKKVMVSDYKVLGSSNHLHQNKTIKTV